MASRNGDAGMVTRILIAFMLLACATARGQTVLGRTNNTTGLVAPDHTLNALAGQVRLTITITGDGVTPTDVSDTTNFLLYVYDRADNYRVVSPIQNTTTPEINATNGQVRFIIPSVNAREYELRAIATPANTNDQYTFHWGYLNVTNAPSAGAASVTINDPTMFVTANGTSTPDSVSIQDQAGTVITGTLVGAHLYLHLPPGVQTVQGVAGAVTLGAGSGTSRVGEVYWDSTTIRYGTNQPRAESLSIPVEWASNTARIDIARGFYFRAAVTGAFVLSFPTARASTNHASYGVIDLIGAQTNWLSFDYSTIDSNSASALSLGTGSVLSIKWFAPAGSEASKVSVYRLL